METLANLQVVIDREDWIKEAQKSEDAGAVATCQAIVHATIGLGVEEEDRYSTWNNDAAAALSERKVATARAIYGHALTVFPWKEALWRRAAELEVRGRGRARYSFVCGGGRVAGLLVLGTLWAHPFKDAALPTIAAESLRHPHSTTRSASTGRARAWTSCCSRR